MFLQLTGVFYDAGSPVLHVYIFASEQDIDDKSKGRASFDNPAAIFTARICVNEERELDASMGLLGSKEMMPPFHSPSPDGRERGRIALLRGYGLRDHEHHPVIHL